MINNKDKAQKKYRLLAGSIMTFALNPLLVGLHQTNIFYISIGIITLSLGLSSLLLLSLVYTAKYTYAAYEDTQALQDISSGRGQENIIGQNCQKPYQGSTKKFFSSPDDYEKTPTKGSQDHNPRRCHLAAPAA